jgi:hypothetical protein
MHTPLRPEPRHHSSPAEGHFVRRTPSPHVEHFDWVACLVLAPWRFGEFFLGQVQPAEGT